MLDYESTMRLGQAQYQDVIDDLTGAGLPTSFTQTGGMNAALEVRLDGGHTLLVTDAEDSLSWARAEHAGWAPRADAPQCRPGRRARSPGDGSSRSAEPAPAPPSSSG
ncbi:MAG: hypothetical protein M3Q22_06875 [Actinomycetota bacterium]|nr:hypothetical protein [Actinomycetota bacterium]